MKRYFITGTDTDCGKTYVTSKLVHYLLENNFKAQAIKPLASGCFKKGDAQVCEDELILNAEAFGGWRLERPVSPHIAAKDMNIHVSAQDLVDFCDVSHFSNLDYLLIEGAGGLLVPINQQETWIDFLRTSQISVILVVGMRLGCLNHAMLTAHALKSHKIDCVGWVANIIDDKMLALMENIETLKTKLEFPLLGTVEFGGRFEATLGAETERLIISTSS